MNFTVACAFEGCHGLYMGEMDALEPAIPRGWYLSPTGEPWCSRHKANEEDEVSKIFMLYKVDADSWTGGKHFVSAHKTLDGAKRGVPEWALQYARECSCAFGEVANYAYFVILEVALLP